ncbi:hypothetical protein QOT17_015189 [Balamuthia mandrillaris]
MQANPGSLPTDSRKTRSRRRSAPQPLNAQLQKSLSDQRELQKGSSESDSSDLSDRESPSPDKEQKQRLTSLNENEEGEKKKPRRSSLLGMLKKPAKEKNNNKQSSSSVGNASNNFDRRSMSSPEVGQNVTKTAEEAEGEDVERQNKRLAKEKRKRKIKKKMEKRKSAQRSAKAMDRLFGDPLQNEVKLDKPDKEGRLFVRKYPRHKWDKEYVILRKKKLHFLKHKGELPPRRSIDIREADFEQVAKVSKNLDHCLEMTHERGIYFMGHKDEAVVKEWLTALETNQEKYGHKKK